MYEDNIQALIGDTPVSVQINNAMSFMAPIDHTHDYAPYEEFIALKRVVDQLIELVGDTPVSQQINNAIK